MERKPKIYRYYAIKQSIYSVVIQRSFTQITKVKCTLTVPRLLDSPATLDDGTPNKGIKISQVCYTGGEIVGTMSSALFTQKVGPILKYLEYGSCVRLTSEQKKIVKELLLNQ
jgi:hypothetical protein